MKSKKNALLIVGAMLALTLSVYMIRNMRENAPKGKPFLSVSVQRGNEWSHNAQDLWRFEAGLSQSPININRAEAGEFVGGSPLLFNYSPEAQRVFDNGHNLEVELEGTAVLNRRPFNLMQLHLQSPSEHTIDGQHYPLEAHFVHTSENGQLAVVMVLFEVGEGNIMMTNLLAGVGQENANDLDVNAFLPADKTYYHYLGSLTTPPLSEKVEWYLMSTPMSISAEQLTALQAYYNSNNRRVQPLNNRAVLHYVGFK